MNRLSVEVLHAEGSVLAKLQGCSLAKPDPSGTEILVALEITNAETSLVQEPGWSEVEKPVEEKGVVLLQPFTTPMHGTDERIGLWQLRSAHAIDMPQLLT